MLKLSDFETQCIQELNLISGIPETTIREVIEYVFIRQMEGLLTDSSIPIPFLGRMHITYTGEEYKEGSREAQIACAMTPSKLLKRIVGEIQDDDSDIIAQLMQRKIKGVAQDILEEDTVFKRGKKNEADI